MLEPVLLDTCALVWVSLDPDHLVPAARTVLLSPGVRYVVSAISFWELAVKQARKTIDLGMSADEYLAKVRTAGNVEIVDLSPELWIRSAELNWDHRDPADRAIVATALARDLPLATRDARILRFYPRAVAV